MMNSRTGATLFRPNVSKLRLYKLMVQMVNPALYLKTVDKDHRVVLRLDALNVWQSIGSGQNKVGQFNLLFPLPVGI